MPRIDIRKMKINIFLEWISPMQRKISSFFPMMDKQFILRKKIQFSIVLDLLTKGIQITCYE